MADAPEVLDQPGGDAGRSKAGRRPLRLPQLVGRRLLVFRILWSVALLFAVVAPIAGFHFQRVNDAEIYSPYTELGLRSLRNGGLGRPLGSEGRAQGVEGGARVLGVDSVPVREDATRREVAALLKAAPGPVVRLTTRTASGEVRHHRLTRSSRHLREAEQASGLTMQQIQLLNRSVGTLAAAAAVLAALLLFIRRPRDSVAALLSLGLLLVVSFSGPATDMWYSFDVPQWAGSGIYNLGLVAFGLALMTFPHGRFEPKWSGLLAILLIGWCAFVPFAQDYELLPSGIDGLGSVALFVACLAILIGRFRRLPPGMERQQIRWVLFGFAVALVAGSISVGGLLIRAGSEDDFVRTWAGVANSVGNAVIILAIAFGLLVSLLRYRLYDAEAAISRSAAVAVLTITLAAVYAGASKGMETYFETTFGREAGAAPGAIGAALAVLLFLPLNRRIEAWAERRFQAPLLRLRRDLPTSLGDMRETSTLAAVAQETLDELRKGVRARHSALVLDGKVVASCNIEPAEVAAWYEAARIERSHIVDCATDDALFPMRLKLRPRARSAEAELGWILLGPRPDGSFFGKDEREVLSEIVDPAARAIEIVQLREQKEARLDARLAALEARLAKPPKRQAPARPRLVRPAV